MALHKINCLNASSLDLDQCPLPVTLPVRYKDDEVALAVYEDCFYYYNLPEPVSELLLSGTFTHGLAYRDEYNQIHADYESGSVLASIQLMFVDDLPAAYRHYD